MIGGFPIAGRPIAASRLRTAAAGTVSVSAAMVEAGDTFAAAVAPIVSASAALVESGDIFAASIAPVAAVTVSIVEAGDVLAASVSVGSAAANVSAAIVEGNDTLAASVGPVGAVSAALLEAGDVLAATVQPVGAAVDVSAAIVEAGDGFAALIDAGGSVGRLRGRRKRRVWDDATEPAAQTVPEAPETAPVARSVPVVGESATTPLPALLTDLLRPGADDVLVRLDRVGELMNAQAAADAERARVVALELVIAGELAAARDEEDAELLLLLA